MGSYMNFKNSGNMDNNGADDPLARQSSIYAMTFDELQSSMPAVQDFGSMNMDELLKSLWTAEESQQSLLLGESSHNLAPGNLQRQGSLTLPRTLSQKTVDEVWRDAFKETANGVGHVGPSLGQREPTFGETTLEEFLLRAGVVREDAVQLPNSSDGIVYDSSSFTFGNEQITNSVINSPRLGISSADILNVNNVVASQQQQQQQTKLQPLHPKQTNMNFSSSAASAKRSNDDGLFFNSPRSSKVMVTDLTASPKINVDGVVLQGKSVVIGGGGLGNDFSVSGVSPNTNGHRNSNASSTSPSTYNNGVGDVGRGRRRTSASLEKVVERRRKRMIKNRESASRSRARKQAYIVELEADIAKLKELNEGLRRKQEKFEEEMQKNQVLEKTNTPPLGNKRICLLRRTVTGPW